MNPEPDSSTMHPADTSVTRKTRWRPQWIVAFIGIVIVIWGPFRFSRFSVCSKCGLVRHSTSRQLPMTQVSYWTSHKLENTPLSNVASTLVRLHEHEWELIHGAGNGIVCAIGEGGPIHTVARSDQVAAFLLATKRHVGVDAAKHCLFLALSASQSGPFRHWLDANDFPVSATIDGSEYEVWRSNADRTLEGLTVR